MRVSLVLLVASLLLFSSYSCCQQPEKVTPSGPAPVLHASTQLVAIDVEVEDRGGTPVRGLERDDFRISENKVEQRVRNFETHSDNDAANLPPIPVLPPGFYTDYTPVRSNAPLNIILVDSLNTDPKDLAYVRQHLGEYVKHADPKA